MTTAKRELPAEVLWRALEDMSSSLAVADARVPDMPLVYVNPAFERVTGYRATDVLGRNCRLLQGRDTDAVARQAIRRAIESRQPASITLVNERPDGTAWWNELHLSPVRNAVGEVTHWVGLQTDVTERVLREQEVQHLAYHDPLTGLPNRNQLEHHLGLAMARADREGTLVALFFLDLDGFKEVNDLYGHSAGDDVLRGAARRLSGAVRTTDLILRHGGDEFLVLVADLSPDAVDRAVTAVRQHIDDALAQPLTIAGRELRLRASVGVALYPRDATTTSELLALADTDMYRGKPGDRTMPINLRSVDPTDRPQGRSSATT